jgi:hypothetical protein
MAVVNKYNFIAEEAITPVTLTAADTATLDLDKTNHVMIIENSTGGDLTVNVSSSGVTTIDVSGVGEIDLSGGKDFSVIDGTVVKIPLTPKYEKWLDGSSGEIDITGGTGATAYIIYA